MDSPDTLRREEVKLQELSVPGIGGRPYGCHEVDRSGLRKQVRKRHGVGRHVPIARAVIFRVANNTPVCIDAQDARYRCGTSPPFWTLSRWVFLAVLDQSNP